MKKLILFIILIVSVGLSPLLFNGSGIDMDFISQQIPFIVETKRMLASGTPFWSWNTWLGDNFIGAYSFYTVTSPFVWFICLFSQKYITTGIIIALYLKFIAAGVFAYSFFKYVGFDRCWSLIGGLCYVFSSFFITNLFYYHFCEPIIVFPLLLIAIEKVLRSDRYSVSFLALVSFVTVWINFYFSLSSFLLAFFYFIARYVQDYKDLKSARQHKTVIFKTFIGVSLGCVMSSVILLPTILHVAGSGRTSIDIGISVRRLGYSIELLRQFIMPKIGERINDGFLYSGCNSRSFFIPVIGFLPVFWILQHRRHVKSNSLLFGISILLVTLFVISLSPLNGIFSAFTNPLYTRWFYGFIFFTIYASLIILSQNVIRKDTFNIYIYIYRL